MKNLTNQQLAFFLARITIGINFLMHGIVRLPKLSAFATGLTQGFSETYLPEFLILPFAYVLPFIELILGILLLAGLKTRFALAASSVLIAILIFGSAFKEDWAGVGTQMIYAIFFFLLISKLEHNAWAVDSKVKPI